MKEKILKIFFSILIVLNYYDLASANDQYGFNSHDTLKDVLILEDSDDTNNDVIADLVNPNKGMIKEKFKLENTDQNTNIFLPPKLDPFNFSDMNANTPIINEKNKAQFGYDKNSIIFKNPSSIPENQGPALKSATNDNNPFGFFSIDDIPTQKHHERDEE